MTTSKRLIASAVLIASVGFAGIAQAVPVFSYEFTNSGETVSPTDAVTPVYCSITTRARRIICSARTSSPQA
jgi:hypothetical protein